MQMRIFFSTGSHVALRLKLQRHCNETKMHREVLHCTGRVVSHQPTLHWVGYTTPDYSTQGALGGLYHTNQPYTGCIGWVTSHFPTCMHTLGAVVGLYHTTLPYSSLPYTGCTSWVISHFPTYTSLHVCIHWVHWLGGWDSVTRSPALPVALLSLVLPSSPFSSLLYSNDPHDHCHHNILTFKLNTWKLPEAGENMQWVFWNIHKTCKLLKYLQNLQIVDIFTIPANFWNIYNACKLLLYLQYLKKSVSQHRVHQWHLRLSKSEILFAKFPEPDTICVGSFANFKIPADLTICVFITQSSSVTSHWNLVGCSVKSPAGKLISDILPGWQKWNLVCKNAGYYPRTYLMGTINAAGLLMRTRG